MLPGTPVPRVCGLICLSIALSLPAGAAADEADDASSPPDLTGLWAKEYTLTSTYTIARIARFTTTSQTYLLAQITQRGASLQMRTRACSVHLGNTAPGFRPEIPDAFVDSLDEGTITATLSRRDGAWHLETPRVYNAQGVHLEEPTRESLPGDPDDPRVIDHEGDGHPGFTVHIEGPFGGSLFLVRRGWEQFSGTVHARSIDGTVQWDADEVVLDATRRILRNSPETTPDLSRSTFRMVPVDADTTCATLNARRHSYFPDPS